MLSQEEKTKIVEFWIQTKRYVTVRRKFILHFGLTGSEKKAAPKNQTIKCVVEQRRKYRSVHQMHKGLSGHLRTVRTPAKVDEIRQSVVNSPRKSLTRRSAECGISKQLTWKCLRDDLKLYPYRITVHHKLNEEDISRRLAMCNLLHQKMEAHSDWINNVSFSDEAHFHINGAVNNHNNRFWGSETPDELKEKSLKGKKVTAFCALNGKYRVLGVYWFKENGKMVTITSGRYCTIMDQFVADLRGPFHPQDFGKFI